MKILSILTMSILLFSACQREDLAPNLSRETSEKMMGKWMVQRIIYDLTMNEAAITELYKPLKLLNNKIEALGTANDCFDFQANELVEIKTTYSDKLKNYKVSNPSEVMIGGESWGIEKLTTTELVLKLQRNVTAQYKRVTTLHLSRSL